MAANPFGNNGGIFGCPSCHGENNYPLIETLKLLLPYFPLHIRQLISMYVKMLEMMNTFEMLMNMMNHMEDYQAIFQMFDGFCGDHSSAGTSPSNAPAPFSGGNFNMPDLSSIQKMMKGSDLVDEFTYVEEPSCPCGNGS